MKLNFVKGLDEIVRFLDYLKTQKRYAAATVGAYKCDLEQFKQYLEEYYSGIEIWKEVDAKYIRSWIVELNQEGLNPRSIGRKLTALKSFFKYLRKLGLVDKNPMLKINTPRTGKKVPAVVSPDSIGQLFDKVSFSNDFGGCRDKLILEMFYATGMRRSELINLKLANIDLGARQLTVLGKRQKERIIPFSENLLKKIIVYIERRAKEFEDKQEEVLFLTNKGKPLYPKMIYNLVNKYLGLVTTIEKKSPHVLRHSFATHLSDNGADLNAIKELLGHENLAATQIYTHSSIEKLKKAYEQAHPKSGE